MPCTWPITSRPWADGVPWSFIDEPASDLLGYLESVVSTEQACADSNGAAMFSFEEYGVLGRQEIDDL